MQEIDLTSHLRSLWKQKRLILTGSLIPSLIVGVVVFAMPAKKNTVYSYNLDWTIAEYLQAKELFGSNESIDRLADCLYAANCKDYADELRRMRLVGAVNRLVALNTYPPLTEKDLDLTRPEQEKMRLTVVTLEVVTRKYGDMAGIASAVRKYFESSFALIHLRGSIKQHAQGLFRDNVNIELGIAEANRRLDAMRAQLKSLHAIGSTAASRPATEDLIMPLLSGRKEFFPVEYQMRAVEVEIAAQERDLKQRQDDLAFGQKRLRLALDLDQYIEQGKNKEATIEQYQEHLASLLSSNSADKAFASCMALYRSNADMMTLRNWRNASDHNAYQIPKNTLAITASVFAALLLIMIAVSLQRARPPIDAGGSGL
jgi:hypothetical protein